MYDIPIITYHKISDQKEFGLTTVSKKQFEIQMSFLKSNGYNSVLLKDLTSDYKFPKNPIIITFDDGYENIYQNAFPVLKKYDFQAVIFVVTSYIGLFNTWEAVPFQQKFRHLSEDQIRDFKDNGHEIASHSKLHKYLPSLDENIIIDEINGSKTRLEELFGEMITSFCYPYGRYNDKIINMVKEAGYQHATTNLRFNNRKKYNPLALMRRSIYMTDSLGIFKSKILPEFSLNISYLTESIIQKGALASIGINKLRRSKSQF